MEISFFYKAFWAILGTLQLFINCVLDISALLLLYLYCLYSNEFHLCNLCVFEYQIKSNLI